MELNSFAILFVAVLTMFFAMPLIVRQLTDMMRWVFQEGAQFDLSASHVPQLFYHLITQLLIILSPILIAMVATGLVVNFAQVGFYITPEPLQPKLEKLNVIKGLKKLFAMRSLVELIRNILKLVTIGWIAYTAIMSESKHFVTAIDSDVLTLLAFIGKAAFRIGIKTALAFLVLSALDYAYQKWEFEKGIKMSKQEIKDELKQYEGSPLTKSRVRRVQQQLSRMRQAREIPKADVVITNPTHLAVALKYDPDNMGAPTVLAKGARLLAEKIKKIAREHNVPVVENKPLARALYQAVEVGGEIPGHLYKAVAEILAHVYRLKNQETYDA